MGQQHSHDPEVHEHAHVTHYLSRGQDWTYPTRQPPARADNQAITVPEPSETLHAGDRLVIVSRRQDSDPFHKLVVG